MKKMKKFMSALLAMSMVFTTLAVSASAAVPAPLSVEQLAYMDLDDAPASLRDDILAARTEIIYGEQSWTVDGAVSIINLEDGTVETLPEFSELFPGWDIPVATTVYEDIEYMPSALNGDITFSRNVAFGLFQGNVNTPDFTDFVGNGRPVAVYALTTPTAGACYNIGFTNITTGRDLGWVCNLSGTAAASVNTESYQRYGVRGSVYRTEYEGWYYVYATQDFSNIGPVIPVN